MCSRLALLLIAPVLAGCQHTEPVKADTSTFAKRIECAELSASGKWENLPNGPFLDNTCYSPSLDTCVYAMKRSIRAEKEGGLVYEYLLVDALTRKQIWATIPPRMRTKTRSQPRWMRS